MDRTSPAGLCISEVCFVMLQSRDRHGLVAVPDAPSRLARLMPWSAGARQSKDGVDARAILDSLDSAVVATGMDGVIRAWNAGAERMYGYAAHEVVDQPYDVIVPRARRQLEAQTIDALLAAKASDDYIATRLHKGGAMTDVRVRISPITDATGAVVGVSTAEDELGASDARSMQDAYLRSAFIDAPIAIALVGVNPETEGQFLRVNQALCELTGYSFDDLRQTNIHALVHPSDLSGDAAEMTRLNEGEVHEFQLEQRLLHAERHAIWVMLSASLVRDATGHPIYCIRQMQ
jgi:PAS domain S-box-containing protein